MVTLRFMRILGDGFEILLAPENSMDDKMRGRAQFWGHIVLLIFGMVADAIDFIQSPTSQH